MVASVLVLAGCASSGIHESGTGAAKAVRPVTAPAAQGDALDAYVALGKPKIHRIIKAFDGVYSDIRVDAVHPGTIRYRYVYAKQVNPDSATDYLEKQMPSLLSFCNTAIFPDMARAGITFEPRVRYVYLNADRSTIWSYTCKPS